ncbi:MAG TPA: hypothetical protein P5137_12920, partial [Candidatus Brocadiia bacterium]|nr:hypothetical protein [Candidatus Brocadiia bacterium]
MALEFRCGCGQPLLAPQEHAGAEAKCPTCGRATTIPWAYMCECGRVSLLFSLPRGPAACPLCSRTMRRVQPDKPPPPPPPPAGPLLRPHNTPLVRRTPVLIAASAAVAILVIALAASGRREQGAVGSADGVPTSS